MTAVASTIKSNEKLISRLLLLGAVLLPMGLAVIFPSGSFDFGRLSGNILGSMAIVVLIAYVATKGRTEQTQNRVMLIVGILLFGYSILSSYKLWHDAHAIKKVMNGLVSTIDDANANINASNNDALSKLPMAFDTTQGSVANFLSGVQPIFKRFVDKSVDLNNRMNALPLDKVLTPETILSKEGITQSRSVLTKQKELIAERTKNLADYWVEVETYFNTAKVDEANRQSALNGFLKDKPMVTKMYGDLDKYQQAFNGEAFAILDLVEKNLGRLQVGNGQILFPDQTTLDAYNQHMQNLLAAGQEADKVAQEIQRIGQANLQQTKQDLGK